MRLPTLLGALCLLGACSVKQPGPTPVVAPPPTAPLQVTRATAISPPLVMRGSFSDGTPLALDALRGRPWVVNLWLPGCPHCAHEFPELEKVRAEYEAQGVGFLALSVDPDLGEVGSAATRLGLQMPWAAGDTSVMRPLGTRTVPDTLYLDAQGALVAYDKGEQTRDHFEARVKSLLGRP